MPTLRPLTDVARPDARFFVEILLPALAAAGYRGAVALIVSDGIRHGDASTADIVVEGSAADLEALLAGRQKAELSVLDKLKAQKRGAQPAIAVRGRAAALRALVDALAPKHDKARANAREIGAEASALKGKKRDRVRTIDGRYIKGLRSDGARDRAPPSAPVASSVVVGHKGAATDRTGFALQNLAAFVGAGLERAGRRDSSDHDDDDDDAVLVLAPGAP